MMRPLHKRSSIGLLLPCLSVLALSAATGLAQDSTSLSARIRERMQKFVDEKEISGAVTLVGR